MHNFQYKENIKTLLTPEIVQMLNKAYEHKGRQELFVEANKDQLNTLLEVAKIQSTKSSNRIEGIFTTDKRLQELMDTKSEPHNRNEEEISGYRDVLATIHDSYDHITPTSNIILQLHRDLYSYSGKGIGGKYKSGDNIIAEEDKNGIQKIRFAPVPAFETEEAMNQLCSSFATAWNDINVEKLLIIPMFILDFLCIHPFDDGNGRMSRLLTLLLLYKAGFIVGKYISLEMIIEQTKDTYYESLKTSSQGWHESQNIYEPFVKYYLGILIKASTEFESRVEYLTLGNISKTERVKLIIKNKVGKISKREILAQGVDISTKTVERALAELVKNGTIEKVGSGYNTCYIWKSR